MVKDMTTATATGPATKPAAGTSKKGRQSIRHVPIEHLLEHPGNIRKDLEDVDEMALSIMQHGILQPLTATEHMIRGRDTGSLILLAGHRRLAGAIKAGKKTVPVIIRHEVTEAAEHVLLMLVENTQRRDINAMDRAEAYGVLRDQEKMSVGEIARRTGTKQSTVSFYLNLLMLDEEDREEVRSGRRAVTHSVAAVRAARKAERTTSGPVEKKPIGRPKGKKTRPYFSDAHPLAKAARALCGHRGVPKVGAIACGPCWEQAIRDDMGATPTVAPLVAVIDESAVEAVLAGEWKTKCTPTEKTEVCRRWHAQGKSLNDLERLTGWTRVSRYFKIEDAVEEASTDTSDDLADVVALD
jgi:ParB family chromosome partitioning protein